METLPNQENTLKAIQALQFLVVVDTMPMEITGWADVVLPECTYLERCDDLRDGPHRKPHIALQGPGRRTAIRNQTGLLDGQGAGKEAGSD